MVNTKATRDVVEEIQLEPLAQVVELQMPRHGEHDVAAQRNREVFCQSLEALADEYACQRRRVDQARETETRYRALSSAAKKLWLAMDILSEEELGALESAQEGAFLAHLGKLDAADVYDLHSEYDVCEEPFKPRPVSKMKEWRDLCWLEQAANSLIVPRERGRPKSVAEQWAAERFVILCHRHKWSPVRLSNSGSERQGGTSAVPSPAVVCLAAVFRAARVDVGREIVLATSALKTLRDRPLRSVEWPQPDDPGIDLGAKFYKVSLQVVEFPWSGEVAALPNFVPRGK
ncbi:hypothetical protein [Bordetella bronchiseptica]|uniref:hypothetical protein n=1 Tax=Bordetella bronchiseptica TaxID=518 RepID=UPI0012692A57|nr:hypothetical protein [Bordetella bronchiseptica]